MTIDQRIYQKIVCGTSLVVQWLRGYFCLENSMDRGTWQAIVYGVTKSQRHPTQLQPVQTGACTQQWEPVHATEGPSLTQEVQRAASKT